MLKLTKYTLFHYFKHNRGLVFIENNHFARFLEEISTINNKFPQPWVAWVAHFSMSVGLTHVTDHAILEQPLIAAFLRFSHFPQISYYEIIK